MKNEMKNTRRVGFTMGIEKKEYVFPECSVLYFDEEDVVRTSTDESKDNVTDDTWEF